MNLQTKIESIRQQPEHVRWRYLWLCMSISMMLVVTLWIFSTKATFQSLQSQNATDSFNQLRESLPSVEAPSLEEWFKKGNPAPEGSPQTPASNTATPNNNPLLEEKP